MSGDEWGAIAMFLAPLVLIILWELDDLGDKWQARKERKAAERASRPRPQ